MSWFPSSKPRSPSKSSPIGSFASISASPGDAPSSAIKGVARLRGVRVPFETGECRIEGDLGILSMRGALVASELLGRPSREADMYAVSPTVRRPQR
eukprot:1023980-Amorphochlora_amoeboformis.AAC.1